MINPLIAPAQPSIKKQLRLGAERAVDGMVALSMTALVGGLVVGKLVDRVSHAGVFATAAGLLVVALFASAAWPREGVSIVGLVVAGGLGVAATWTVGRQLVIAVAPPERCGEALGLYGVTTKASIVGTSLFAMLRDGFGYGTAVLAQAAALAGAVVLLLAFDRRHAAEGKR